MQPQPGSIAAILKIARTIFKGSFAGKDQEAECDRGFSQRIERWQMRELWSTVPQGFPFGNALLDKRNASFCLRKLITLTS
jgi:hypothetical protein